MWCSSLADVEGWVLSSNIGEGIFIIIPHSCCLYVLYVILLHVDNNSTRLKCAWARALWIMTYTVHGYHVLSSREISTLSRSHTEMCVLTSWEFQS